MHHCESGDHLVFRVNSLSAIRRIKVKHAPVLFDDLPLTCITPKQNQNHFLLIMDYFDAQTMYFSTCCGVALGFLYYFANVHYKIETKYEDFNARRRMIVFSLLATMLAISCIVLGTVIAIRFILISTF